MARRTFFCAEASVKRLEHSLRCSMSCNGVCKSAVHKGIGDRQEGEENKTYAAKRHVMGLAGHRATRRCQGHPRRTRWRQSWPWQAGSRKRVSKRQPW